jgi:hypothetical protein
MYRLISVAILREKLYSKTYSVAMWFVDCKWYKTYKNNLNIFNYFKSTSHIKTLYMSLNTVDQ